MADDYGEGPVPRGHDGSWGDRDDSADGAGMRYGGARPQPPRYEPRPPRAGDGQYGGRRSDAAGHGESQPPRGEPTGPPAGFRPPRQRTALRDDTAGRTGPYPDRDHRTADAYGSAGSYRMPGGPTKSGGDPDWSGAPAAYGGPGAGPRRAPQQYGPGRYQPSATVPEPQWEDTGPPARRRSRTPLVFLIIFVVLVTGGGAGWYYLQGSADRSATGPDRRIADRTVDPVPLTATEVFGSTTIPGGEGKASYKVLKTQVSTDCKTAAGGAIAEILTTAGCTQVVRATVVSPDTALVITMGIFNLETVNKAAKASAAIKTAVDTQKGRFSGLIAGGRSNIINRAAANLAWDVRGHYLVYCLIAKADGSAIAAADSRTQPTRNDLIERYLRGVVIQRRAVGATPAEVPSTRES